MTFPSIVFKDSITLTNNKYINWLTLDSQRLSLITLDTTDNLILKSGSVGNVVISSGSVLISNGLYVSGSSLTCGSITSNLISNSTSNISLSNGNLILTAASNGNVNVIYGNGNTSKFSFDANGMTMFNDTNGTLNFNLGNSILETTNRLVIYNTENSNFSGGGALVVHGGIDVLKDIVVKGSVTTLSDEKLKCGIQSLPENTLDFIKDIRCVRYQTIFDETKTKIGFIAQDFIRDFPEVVNKYQDNLTLEYQNITSILLKCIQELNEKIEKLKD